jgi:hypothetical protein
LQRSAKSQSRGRNELHQTNQSQIERTVGQRIDLPADGNGADLETQFGEPASGKIEQERAMQNEGFAAGVRDG